MTERKMLTADFEEHRPHLRAVAYRMLGSVDDAEDAVQEAWLRLSRADASDVENLGGWLTTVVARISLNMLRSRRTRGESELDEVRLPDPILGPADSTDPEHEALIADSVGIALLVVLEQLSPAERLAFVLHDVFSVPFAEIAPMIDRSAEATRQLASRARRRVRGGAPEPDADLAAQREVVDAFFAAAKKGDFARLVALLAPDVVLRVDLGVGRSQVFRGAQAVSERARTFADPLRVVRPATINGGAGVVVLIGERPVSLLAFTVAGGRVAAIDALADRERLQRLDLSALDARG